MQVAPLPADEPLRLDCLHRLHQLDTPAEDRFDRLTRLAQRHFGVAGVMVTLVDRERQWFKSARGTLVVETPREISFCAHTILADQPLVIPDLRQDERFHDNPVVQEMQLHFYAGVPVYSPEGQPVGTFCLLDGTSRSFARDDLRALQDFAACAEGELHRRQLSEGEREILAELEDLRSRSCLDEASRSWTESVILDIFHREFLRAQRQQSPLGVLRVGLNRETDEHLRQGAEAVRRCLRPYDSLGRLAGAELLVVVPGAGSPQCVGLARRILSSLSSADDPELAAWVGVTATDRAGDASSAALLESARAGLEAARLGETGSIVLPDQAALAEGPTGQARAHSLGAFEVVMGGDPIPEKDWKNLRTRYLLAFLLGEKGRSAPEEIIFEHFFPRGGEGARRSLRLSLGVLRELFRPALGQADVCWREGDRVLAHPSLWSDVEDFVRCAQEGRRLHEGGLDAQAMEELQRMALLYRGPYLDGYYGDWALQRRERLEGMFADAGTLLARLLSERQQPREALDVVERVLAVAPERADALAICYRCLLALGRADAVVARHKKLASQMRREYATEPSIELVELYTRAKLGLTS